MNKRLLAMVKPLALGICAIAFIALAQGQALADPVSFSTTGCFGAGCTPLPGDVTAGSGSASLTFTGQPPTTVDTSTPSGFTNADLGQFQVNGIGTFSSTPFTLVINQTVPGAGTGTFTGTLSGTLIVNGSDAKIVFDQTTLVIAGVNYQLVNLTNGNELALDPNATLGITRMTARLSTIPEPMTMVLFGTGLAGIAASARRRRKAAGK